VCVCVSMDVCYSVRVRDFVSGSVSVSVPVM
jgi:hypothetical protein